MAPSSISVLGNLDEEKLSELTMVTQLVIGRGKQSPVLALGLCIWCIISQENCRGSNVALLLVNAMSPGGDHVTRGWCDVADSQGLCSRTYGF